MSLHYLLDGYNIVKQTPKLNQGTLENQRQSLVQWINACRPQGSSQNSVTVVFDGKDDVYGFESSSHIKVIFSRGQSADDLIKKIIEQSPIKNRWVVVSDDKDIKLYVRALGAKVLSVREFIKASKVGENFKPSPTIQGYETQAGKNISLTDQAKITKELEKIWIRPTGNPKS